MQDKPPVGNKRAHPLHLDYISDSEDDEPPEDALPKGPHVLPCKVGESSRLLDFLFYHGRFL